MKTPFPDAISLARFISTSGYCSHKNAMDLIDSGKVKLNNKINYEFWTPVHPYNDTIKVGKDVITFAGRKKYYAFHKPVGLITSHSNSEGKATIYDFVRNKGLNLWVTSAGRLDVDTSGLMILTNDTEFIHYLSHPETKVNKLYSVTVFGKISDEILEPLRHGIQLKAGEICAPVSFKIITVSDFFSEINLTLTEGKNRQIRRMMKTLNLNLLTLKRIGIGNYKLENLPEGEFTEIQKEEII